MKKQKDEEVYTIMQDVKECASCGAKRGIRIKPAFSAKAFQPGICIEDGLVFWICPECAANPEYMRQIQEAAEYCYMKNYELSEDEFIARYGVSMLS